MLNKHTRQKQQQQGFTLVELSITLVLIAGFLLAGLYFVQRIQLENAINKTTADATVTMNAAIAATAGDASTANHSVTSLAAMNVWPKDRLIYKDGAVSEVAGQFPGSTEKLAPNVAIATTPPLGANQGFTYTLNNIPSEACASVVKNLALHPNVVQAKAGDAGATSALTDLVDADDKKIIVSPSNLGKNTTCGGSKPKKIEVSFFKS